LRSCAVAALCALHLLELLAPLGKEHNVAVQPLPVPELVKELDNGNSDPGFEGKRAAPQQ
jgi:hypothetical protein